MAVRRPRGAPPGNLNACRRKWDAFWRRRALKPGDEWVHQVLREYIEGLVSDKPDMSEAERRTSEIAQVARGASILILAECARSGFIIKVDGKGWDLAPGAKELAKFLSIERQSLQALGFERREKALPSAVELIRESRQG